MKALAGFTNTFRVILKRCHKCSIKFFQESLITCISIFIIIDYLVKTKVISLAMHQHCLYQLNS